ncbi:MAG: gamma-glutamylcyclotransferase [Actinomycetota bacterium]|nr:gamma-glutamylcyclotransferase [Actinomycetota bacterium]
MPNMGTIEAIERAKAYPFRRPECSYVFTHHHERLLEGHPDTWELDLGHLTAVFGYGSNPSPVSLAHKFASIPEVHIPVIRFELHDFDAVYSSHVSAGYVPATLLPSPGTVLQGFMTYLNDEELELMDQSESRGENYERVNIPEAEGYFEDGSRRDGLTTYMGLHGTIQVDGSPVAVEDTEATGRQFQSLPQAEMLDRVIEQVAPGTPHDEFIGTAVANRTQRRSWTSALKQTSLSNPGT